MLKKFTLGFLFFFMVTSGTAWAASEGPVSLADAQEFRIHFNRLLDGMNEMSQRLIRSHDPSLIAKSRKAMESVTDDQISKVFSPVGLPDLMPALTKIEEALTLPPSESASLSVQSSTIPGFPDLPPLFPDCNNIEHDSAFRHGALIAFQVARTILAAARFVCLEDILGENVALVCLPLDIAEAATAIPLELGEFCDGEEGGRIAEASFDRLDHIHTDLHTHDKNIEDRIKNHDTNIGNQLSAHDTNIEGKIATHDTRITTQVKIHDADIKALLAALQAAVNANSAKLDILLARQLETIRLLHTPEGIRTSAVPACNNGPCKWNP